MKHAKIALMTVGVISMAMGAFGLWYNLEIVFMDFDEVDVPHFYSAFYTMSAICVACYLALLICGIQFVRLRTTLLLLFNFVIVFEVLYVVSLGPMWLLPEIGRSIGVATGVANGGMAFQAFILFPLWGPLLATWAAKRLAKTDELANHAPETVS